jgi:hypothetical protein
MRKIYSIFLALILAAAAVPAFAEEIDWIDDYDRGLAKAERANKNMFVLITAPSWCGPCQWMEANTFTDETVISYINRNFVPLRVEDTKNGARNPDLDHFDFSGYPTVFIRNTDELDLIKSVGAADANQLLAKIRPAADVGYDPSEDYLHFKHDDGFYRQTGMDTWEVLIDGERLTLQETQRNAGYIYLYNESEEYFLAVPESGGNVQKTEDKGQSWDPLHQIVPAE